MKKNFVDECKDRVFNALLDKAGESFEDKYEMADEIASFISDDVIYYSEGEEAVKMYTDAFVDFWDCEGDMYKDLRDFNPYSPAGVLDVWRDMVLHSCSTIMGGITEDFRDGPLTLGKKELVDLSIALDDFEEYPFLVNGCIQYDYYPEKRSFYSEATVKLYGSFSDLSKVVGEAMENRPISAATEQKIEDNRKKDLDNSVDPMKNNKKGGVKL